MAAYAQAHSLQLQTKPDAGLRTKTMQLEAKGQDSRIKDVWMENFFEAIDEISLLLDKFNYISMVNISHRILFLALSLSFSTDRVLLGTLSD
jgi:hypothetical protein